jgi:hypothetical protein
MHGCRARARAALYRVNVSTLSTYIRAFENSSTIGRYPVPKIGAFKTAVKWLFYLKGLERLNLIKC